MLEKLKSVIKWGFLIYFTLGVIIWVFSPIVVRYFLKEQVKNYSLELSSETNIRYNPFTAHLSIKDLSLSTIDNVDDVVFSLKSLELEFRLYHFLFNEVYVSEFVINGLNIQTTKSGENFIIAGIKIPLTNNEENNTENSQGNIALEHDAATPVTNLPSEPATVMNYMVVVPQLLLINSEINFVTDNIPHQLKFNQLDLNNLKLALHKQELNLAINSEVNGSPLNINITGNLNNNAGIINIDVELNKLQLQNFQHLLPENIEKLAGEVSVVIKNTINLEQSLPTFDISEFKFLVNNLDLVQNGNLVSFKEQQLLAENIQLSFPAEQSPEASGQASFKIDELLLAKFSDENVLAKVTEFTIENINLLSIDKVDLTNIQLNAIVLSDNISDDTLPLSTIGAININNIMATPKNVAIGIVNIENLFAEAKINQDKKFINLIKLAENTETEQSTNDNTQTAESSTTVETLTPARTDTTKENTFHFSVQEVNFINGTRIEFTDESVKPLYHRDIDISQLSISSLDSQLPDNKTHLKVIGNSNKYANFDLTSEMTPFAKEAGYTLKGFINEISLPSISSYIKDALQHEIESGQLNIAVDARVQGHLLSGDANILIRAIEFKAVEGKEESIDKTSVPFNVALGMLKDGDGNVALNLPLSGDLDDPSFGFSGFMTLIVKQATMSAAKDYLFATFVPYASVVKIAMVAGEYALKISINDFIYAEKTTKLPVAQDDFLKQFSALMHEKEDLHVKLCAVATPADINLPLGKRITDEKLIEQLNQLSHKRVEIFKAHMVDNEKVPSVRLLMCKPSIEYDVKSQPRIVFKN